MTPLYNRQRFAMSDQAAKQDRVPGVSASPISVFQIRVFLRSSLGFLLAGILLAALLVVGSFHSSAPTRAQRIEGLDNIIKCPVCADISIAQSNSQIAGQLRASVKNWVMEGKTNSWIESTVVAKFGSEELLDPQNNLVFIIPAAVIVIAFLVLLSYYFQRFRRYRNLSSDD